LSINVHKPCLLGLSYMIGDDKPLDPGKYFIVTIGLFSGGEVRWSIIHKISIHDSMSQF
jgi:hypothetical protein